MKVKVKKLSPLAKMPYKKYDSDFCFDVYATSCEEVAPNVYKYGLGFAIQIERGDEEVMILGNERFKNRVSIDTSQMPLKFDIDLRPRSSVGKTGMVLSNSVGTVDESYTGEVSAVFYHVMPNMPKYEIGDRIAQCKIGFTLPIDFVEVEELDDTARASGGYGSTGLK